VKAFLTVVGVLAFLAFGLAQFAAGAQAANFYFGGWWSWGLIVLTLMFRFTLPMTIAAFFGARDVWHWHWALAALFAAPGLLLMIPALTADLFDGIKRSWRRAG
jgi:hypothetical protein